MSAMTLVHDAASLNAIATNAAVASQAWLHEKLGRDVEVSCVCPWLVHVSLLFNVSVV